MILSWTLAEYDPRIEYMGVRVKITRLFHEEIVAKFRMET